MLVLKLLKNPTIQALLIPLLLGVLAYIGKEYLLVFYYILAKKSATLLLDFALLSVTLNVMLLFWLIITIRGKRQEKINAFGVKWDQDQNAYCPKCEIPMADYDSYGMYEDEGCFLCQSCNGKFKLVDKRGARISLSSAVDSLENRGIGAIGISTLFFLVLVLLLAIWKFNQ